MSKNLPIQTLPGWGGVGGVGGWVGWGRVRMMGMFSNVSWAIILAGQDDLPQMWGPSSWLTHESAVSIFVNQLRIERAE